MTCSQSVFGLKQSIWGFNAPPLNWKNGWSWLLGWGSHDEYTNMYGYTFDTTCGESWYKDIG